MKDYATEILRRNNLSVTESRKVILNLFLQQGHSALKHSDIEHGIDSLDRVTIYRTLQVFTEKGIIHTIPSIDGSARYALCGNGCIEGSHQDNHVHFVCSMCGSTHCIENVYVPQVILPIGYEPRQVEMVVTGICNTCGRKN